jgi:hypothetical protein
MNKFTFVHPTKCGGTSINSILRKYYSNYFIVESQNKNDVHKTVCKDNNNPIILVRDPVDRFKSMYKYWKYGSKEYNQRSAKYKSYIQNMNIKHYIHLIKTKSPILNNSYTWDKHYAPTTDWIKVSNYNKLIIVKYCKDLNIPFQKMINAFNIPNLNIPIPHSNVSKKKEIIILDQEDLQFIQEYFKTDYELIELINTNPRLFRGVF